MVQLLPLNTNTFALKNISACKESVLPAFSPPLLIPEELCQD
jgi:hypothetical protein